MLSLYKISELKKNFKVLAPVWNFWDILSRFLSVDLYDIPMGKQYLLIILGIHAKNTPLNFCWYEYLPIDST